MLSLGRSGYRDAARRILETAARMKHAIRAIPELRLVRDPLFVLAFTSDAVDVYRVLDAMAARGWSLNGLQKPPAVHVAVTLRHCEPGVAEKFAADLQASVAEVKARPAEKGGMAPVYGVAASLPFRGVVADLLRAYVDRLYRV
jgi:glutamate/tyrosine decarboxylase-like PLP-dependent enzyme